MGSDSQVPSLPRSQACKPQTDPRACFRWNSERDPSIVRIKE